MIPEIDIWRAPNWMIKRYGEKALEESTMRADEFTAGGITMEIERRLARDAARPSSLVPLPRSVGYLQ